MSKTPPPPPKPVEARSPKHLAELLGINVGAIMWHRRKRDSACPKDLDVAAWKLFLAAYGRTGTVTGDDMQMKLAKAKLKREEAKAENEELILKRAKGEVIDFQDVATFIRELVCVGLIGEWDRTSREMPPSLVGLTAAQMFIEFQKGRDRLESRILKRTAEWIEQWEARKA